MLKKRRSDISKLVSHSREVWRQSVPYQYTKKICRVPGKSGWFICQLCKRETEVIKVDHITPIGKQPDELCEFGDWLVKLFCENLNLQGVCNECHKTKSREERKKGAYK